MIGPKHPIVQQYLAIQSNSKPNPLRFVVLDGLWEVESAIDAGLELIALIYAPERLRGNRHDDVMKRAATGAGDSFEISGKLADRLSDRDTSDGLLAIAVSRQWTLDDIRPGETSLVLVLDGLEVMGNVGTAVRSAQASGADAVLLTNRRVRLTHPRLIHASMAASLTMPTIDCTVDEAAKWFHANGFQAVMADTRAPASYKSLKYSPRAALVLGSERYGIHKDWDGRADAGVSIPMFGGVDSLNVANAATILLFEVASQHRPEEFGLSR